MLKHPGITHASAIISFFYRNLLKELKLVKSRVSVPKIYMNFVILKILLSTRKSKKTHINYKFLYHLNALMGMIPISLIAWVFHTESIDSTTHHNTFL